MAGNVYSGGWTKGAGGESPVIEPATGAELGTVGLADAEDVAAAAAVAAAAQRRVGGAAVRRAGRGAAPRR